MGYSDNPVMDAARFYDRQDAYNDRRERVYLMAVAEICGADADSTSDVLGDYMSDLSSVREPLRTVGKLVGPISDAELISIMLGNSPDDSLIASACREFKARYIASAYASKVIDNTVDKYSEE